jgi:hypothetical protein
VKTIEAAAAARGMTVDAFRTSEFERLRRRHAEAVGRRPATDRTGSVTLAERRNPAPKAAAVASPAVLERELAGAFKRLGFSTESAHVAARGRGDRPGPASLTEGARRLGMSSAKAQTFARGRGLQEAVTDGSGFLAGDYAYVGDEMDPTTWKLLLVLQPGDGALGAYDDDLVAKAAAAIAVPEWGAPQVEIPAADLDRVKQTIAGAWVQSGLALADMPPALAAESLRTSFRRLGMSERAATVAAEGRGRRS